MLPPSLVTRFESVDESIREFRLAARQRFEDGVARADADHRTGAIYSVGLRRRDDNGFSITPINCEELMPRRRTEFKEQTRRTDENLVDRLVEELKGGGESAQPIIDEEEFSSGLLRITVIWDDWDRLPPENRTSTILRAYEVADQPLRERITLASGLTVPEAYAAGRMPYRIIPAWRTGDPVTLEQCREAMIDEGASTLFSPENPRLLFATREDAEAARARLGERLPVSSGPVWTIAVEDRSQN